MDFTYLSRFMDHIAAVHSPGCAASVTVGGKEVFRKAAGASNLEQGIPMTGEELFFIYSCSKITTVVAALTLLEQGKIFLSDPLYAYIPEFRYMTVKTADGEIIPAENPITIFNLFTMTAGFDYDLQAACFQKAGNITGGQFDTVQTVKCLAEKPLCFEPGARWQYSVCHDVLAALVEVVSGMKFRDYVKKMIFDPLGMEQTYYHATPQRLPSIAEQYQFIADGKSADIDIVEAQKMGSSQKGHFLNVGKKNAHILGPEYDSGGAGIITGVGDYMKLLSTLANFGTGLNGNRILSPQTVELMRRDALNTRQKEDFSWKQLSGYSYGLGVRTMLDPIAGNALSPAGEFGWCGAAGATALIDPSNQMAMFFVQHELNPREDYYFPKLRNALYAGL